MSLQWNELDDRAVKTAKLLAGDAVEEAGNGHPGTAISLAPAAYLLFQRHLRFDPKDPHWIGRDKFVLSIGHSSLTQYIQLYLAGMGVSLDDLKRFRKFEGPLPGHPEHGFTPGVEVTTGPLGSGVAAAVGFAMSARRVHGMFDPQTELGESVFDHNVYCLCGDGDLQEGISGEASSIAGVQKLGNLIMIYDDNHISIEDDTAVAFNEDVLARYESYGWHAQRVDWLADDGSYCENVSALNDAIEAAKAQTDKPSIIALRTIIGWPTPGKQNTGGIHGAKLGSSALEGLKEVLGADPKKMFDVDEEAVAHARENAARRAEQLKADWAPRFEAWKQANPQGLELLERIDKKLLPAGWADELPVFEAGSSVATRSASGKAINALAAKLPELWGGSADLAGSNNTIIAGGKSFLPADVQVTDWSADPYGRILHFGIREHAMAGIMNGIALDGFTRVFGGTFFVFADYMRGAVRLAALMNLPVTYVWTHDSIGVGEDGPTHQPIEHLTSYRAIPNLFLVRPMDANETSVAWREVIERRQPTGLILSRQNLPVFAREDLPQANAQNEYRAVASANGLAQGGYVLRDTRELAPIDVILMGSGSEVSIALAAADLLEEKGLNVRVVSMPCMEWFDDQSEEYRESVLPESVKARVSIEAGLTEVWRKYVGDKGASLGINSFGLPGDADSLYQHFGLTAENMARKALELLG